MVKKQLLIFQIKDRPYFEKKNLKKLALVNMSKIEKIRTSSKHSKQIYNKVIILNTK